MTANISPTETVSPSFFKISVMTPLVSAWIAWLTLSVSSSTISSPADTLSPAFLSQLAMVASTTDSPMLGTTIWVGMNLRFRPLFG